MLGWGVCEQGWRKGPWTPEEDKLLTDYVNLHGDGRWSSVSKSAGLNRSGKSCRLRWVNYLRPGLKKGQITPQEEGIIIELHALWGNKWSTIARYLPGRTDNEIKNYWRTHFKKKPIKPSQIQEKRKSQALIKRKQAAENEMKEIAQHHGDDHETILSEAQGNYKQEMVFESQTMEQHYCSWPVMEYQEDVESWSDAMALMAEDDGLWGSLWNLEGPNIGHQDQPGDCTRIAPTQNQPINAYSCGADTSNLYNWGYNF